MPPAHPASPPAASARPSLPPALLPLLNLGHFLTHMGVLIFPTAVLSMGDGFGAGYGERLALATGGFIAFGAASLPAGWLGDHWSRRKMMAIGFIGMGVAALLCGLATTPTALALGLTLLGGFAAIYHPVGIAMLVAHAGRLGTAIGVNGVAGNLGIAAAPLLTGVVAAAYDWRAAFWAFAAVAIAAGFAFLGLVAETPPAAPRRPPAAATPTAATTAAAATVARSALLRAIVCLALVSVAGGIVFNATTLAMPKLFDERAATLLADKVALAGLVSAVFVFGAVGQIVVGRLIDRYPLKRVFVPLSLLQAPALAAVAAASGLPLVFAAAVLMFAVFGQMTINDSIVARYASDAWRARAFAVRYLVTFVAAATAVPLVALLHDGGGGFGAPFRVLAALGAVVFTAALIFPGGGPRPPSS